MDQFSACFISCAFFLLRFISSRKREAASMSRKSSGPPISLCHEQDSQCVALKSTAKGALAVHFAAVSSRRMKVTTSEKPDAVHSLIGRLQATYW
ncbi:uncharacterized protein LOC142767569 isoform X2 [Rhipicephalus microplus]|uniref:uncharacterized protein LOC142767569 isoform X2 n=1 Tax=Rhipicephalus microplus TaxID=6941 RepID=UPI003F6D80B9